MKKRTKSSSPIKMQNAKFGYPRSGCKIQNLRKKYPKFIYERYSYKISGNNLEIFFDFKIEPNIHFRPRITVEKVNKLSKSDFDRFNNLIFHLGLMEIPSYWKATCSPEIIIKAGFLNPEQIKYPSVAKGGDERRFIDWWKDLMINGMGQFFYENKINFRKKNFLKIKSDPIRDNSTIVEITRTNQNRVLVPVGGGKDSVITLELLKKAKKNIQCFSLNPTEAAQKIMILAECKKPIIIRRRIDEKLLELNRQGFLNGHTPFSAYLAFLSALVAAIFGYKYVAFSNERSASEGNVKYLGKIINHQWSKSFEFEQKFREYSQKYLTSRAAAKGEEENLFSSPSVIEYFSFLRPLYEIQIAKLFSKYPKYFNAFLSCNEAYKTASGTKKPTKKWCRSCSKCLFVFATLYPFVDKKELLKIFGKNLFEDKKLLPVMQELIGERKFKPFECVGTKKESLIAFYLSWKKCGGRAEVPAEGRRVEGGLESAKLPFLLRYFGENILPKYPNLEKESKKIMNSWNNQNNLPKEFERVLKKVIS